MRFLQNLLNTIVLAVILLLSDQPYTMTHLNGEIKSENGYEEGRIYLSRDLGYFMNELLYTDGWVISDNRVLFDQQVEKLKESFLFHSEEGRFIRWSLSEETKANGLADDIRIITALYTASKQFDRPDYKKLADELAVSIERVQVNSGIYADYVNWEFNEPAGRLTLSALTPELFDTLKKAEKTKQLLVDADNGTVFFPEFYDIVQQQYKQEYDVYIEEQLMIAINRQQINKSSPAFQEWIINEWDKHKKIPKIYSRHTLSPTSKEESLAVYLHLSDYLQLAGADKPAQEVKQYIKTLVEEKRLEEISFSEYKLFEMMQ